MIIIVCYRQRLLPKIGIKQISFAGKTFRNDYPTLSRNKKRGRLGMCWLLIAILALCLFVGAKISKRKQWNEDVLSYEQTKSFLGFCALIIILHHCALRTCASWLAANRIVHGLDAFVFLGYLCVAVFFSAQAMECIPAAVRKKDSLKDTISVF